MNSPKFFNDFWSWFVSKFINASVLMTSPAPGKFCNSGYKTLFVTIVEPSITWFLTISTIL